MADKPGLHFASCNVDLQTNCARSLAYVLIICIKTGSHDLYSGCVNLHSDESESKSRSCIQGSHAILTIQGLISYH